MIESNRQKKIAGVLQKDLIDILQGEAQQNLKGILISITKVYVTSDLGEAKIYVSVFPSKHSATLIEGIKKNTSVIRYELAKRTKNQLRRMPVLHFYNDDSLDYIEGIKKKKKSDDNLDLLNPEK